MQLAGFPFQVIDWSQIAPTTHAGAPGTATWRTVTAGAARVRLVEYSPGYVADHWCAKGHVVLVLAGELISEQQDGSRATLVAGQVYVVADGDGAHRSHSPGGARLFIVD